MQYSLNYSGTRFLPLKIKITQFHDGFRLKHCCLFILPDCSPPFPLLPSVPSHPPFYQVPLPLDPPPPPLASGQGTTILPFLNPFPSHLSPLLHSKPYYLCLHITPACTAEFWKKYLFFYFLKAFWVLNQHDWSIFCIILVSLPVWMVDVSPFACNLLVVGTVLLPISQEHWKH